MSNLPRVRQPTINTKSGNVKTYQDQRQSQVSFWGQPYIMLDSAYLLQGMQSRSKRKARIIKSRFVVVSPGPPQEPSGSDSHRGGGRPGNSDGRHGYSIEHMQILDEMNENSAHVIK
jgi:hypothetical protein